MCQLPLCNVRRQRGVSFTTRFLTENKFEKRSGLQILLRRLQKVRVYGKMWKCGCGVCLNPPVHRAGALTSLETPTNHIGLLPCSFRPLPTLPRPRALGRGSPSAPCFWAPRFLPRFAYHPEYVCRKSAFWIFAHPVCPCSRVYIYHFLTFPDVLAVSL